MRFGQRVHAEGRRGDHTHGALGAHKELEEPGAGRVIGNRGRRRELAGGEGNLYLKDHVFRLAVLGRSDAGPSSCQPATDSGAKVERARLVGHRKAKRAECLLELGPGDAGFDVDDQAGFVDFQDAVHPGQVEGDSPVQRKRPTLSARPTSARHHRDAMVARDPDHICHFLSAPWLHHHIGRGQLDAVESVELGHPRPVRCLGGQFRGVDRRVLDAHDIRELM